MFSLWFLIFCGTILSIFTFSKQLWDYGSGKMISTFNWPSDERRGEYLYCARFWDQHHVVAGGSGTNDLKMININVNQVWCEVILILHRIECPYPLKLRIFKISQSMIMFKINSQENIQSLKLVFIELFSTSLKRNRDQRK